MQNHECKPGDLPAGFFWYHETDRRPVVIEKRDSENFVRFTSGQRQEWIRAGEHFVGPLPFNLDAQVTLHRQVEELRQLGQAMLDWIDAVPKNVELPAMPGFDRDWAERVLAALPGEYESPLAARKVEVFTGYFLRNGERIQVDFSVPAGASQMETDAAFLASLAQNGEVNYLSLGVTDEIAPATSGKSGPAL